LVIEEVKESAGVPQADTGAASPAEDRNRKLVDEAAEFFMRQILERGATFFDG